MTLLEDFKRGDLRALARLISLCEDGDRKVLESLGEIFKLPGHARVIGITGPPGAGKSTLINTFVKLVRSQGKKVAVLAVDPVSPFSGGALLGDRIRLMDHFNDPHVFIRSLSTRGKLGGLSLATRQGVTLLDRFGFDTILVETVGVGQSEVDVRKLADATLVALVPEWGDSVQALKAGILEIADIFVINKSDREGADRIQKDLKDILHLAGKDDTPVLKTTFNDLKTVEELFMETEKFCQKKAQAINKKRVDHIQETALELLELWVIQEAKDWLKGHLGSDSNPYEIVKRFQSKYPAGTLFS